MAPNPRPLVLHPTDHARDGLGTSAAPPRIKTAAFTSSPGARLNTIPLDPPNPAPRRGQSRSAAPATPRHSPTPTPHRPPADPSLFPWWGRHSCLSRVHECGMYSSRRADSENPLFRRDQGERFSRFPTGSPSPPSPKPSPANSCRPRPNSSASKTAPSNPPTTPRPHPLHRPNHPLSPRPPRAKSKSPRAPASAPRPR